MADAGVREAALSFETSEIPDARYREQLLGLLTVQAVPVWSVGRQAAYEEHVMDGPSLEHWVRTADAWAQVERDIWQLDVLLVHLGVGSWRTLPLAVAEASSVTDALESWVDLLFVQLAIDRLGAVMAQACTSSSYGPLGRTARLLAFGKRGLHASGVVGLREVVAERQLPAAHLEPRADVWLELASSVARRFAAMHDAERFGRALVGPLDVDAEVASIDREVHALLGEGS